MTKIIKSVFLFSLLLFVACSKDDELAIPNTVSPDPSAGADTQDFMWKALNYWYFWQTDVPNLADNKFPNTTAGSEAYTEFLLSESDPGAFFDNQLLFNEDRFSVYRENYKDLVNSLSGISKSNGLEFGLISYSGSDNIFGYVRYIIANSDAATKDIHRGDIFTGVNGLTLTKSNYIGLLFGDADSYTLNMADIDETGTTPNGKEVQLTKQEGLAENPVFLSKTFEVNGEVIGYLAYNGFTNEYDEQLNKVFGDFKATAVKNLVLDLRYNPGGSVNTTRLLGSMIFDTDAGNLFLKKRYNSKVQSQFESDVYFTDKTSIGTAINTLKLNKVYIITTSSSASASELIINCLEPYIDVIHIGETTRGKNEFSTTMVDDRENSYIYNPARVNNINSKVQWGLQPLIGRNENAAGFSDYTAGLTPDIKIVEDLTNLDVLGDQNEPLLARAIQEITGVAGKRDFTPQQPIKIMTSSKMFAPLKDNMYDNSPVKFDLQ